jgi:hypothetical protein
MRHASKPVTHIFKYGGFGENPKPTVKVWMGEGSIRIHVNGI